MLLRTMQGSNSNCRIPGVGVLTPKQMTRFAQLLREHKIEASPKNREVCADLVQQVINETSQALQNMQ